jgi:hypothetical protein
MLRSVANEEPVAIRRHHVESDVYSQEARPRWIGGGILGLRRPEDRRFEMSVQCQSRKVYEKVRIAALNGS